MGKTAIIDAILTVMNDRTLEIDDVLINAGETLGKAWDADATMFKGRASGQ